MKGETRGIPVTILLTVVTCGIYGLFWHYWITSELRDSLDRRDLNPSVELLLSILCPPYFFYWLVKISKFVEEAGESSVRKRDNRALIYLLPVVVGLLVVGVGIFPGAVISLALIQDDLNEIWDRP